MVYRTDCSGPVPGNLRRRIATFLLAILPAALPAADDKPALMVPAGFRVLHVADDDLAHDIHSLTFDAQGRTVVSGPGYVRILIDTDDDGRADRFKTFADGPKTGAQGMFFMGPHLLCSGDEGLLIYRDDNGDDQADGPPQTFLKIKAGGEHHVHSIQRGPDGWWYIIAGNMAGVTGIYAALPTSPLRHPDAGVLIRLKPDLSGGEIVADGFRNAYDFAFSESGDVFTFDSDGERDVSLPWYRPCRVLQVTPRSNAGWKSRSWKRPDDFFDMPPVVAEFGRGSPTGVTCYRHTHFPGRYEGAIFALDWSFGRVLALSLQPDGSSWKANSTVFARGSGHFGFAPTDLEVAPDGSLYVSVGGRGSRGGVYRISHDGHDSTQTLRKPGDTIPEQLDYVLNMPQAGSSWSRALWYPVAQQLGATAFATAATDEARPPRQRVRAIEVLTDVFGGPDVATLHILRGTASALVRARAAWSVGRSRPESPHEATLIGFLNDPEPLVTRFALEVLTTVTDRRLLDACLPRIAVTLGSPDDSVRAAAANVMVRLSDNQRRRLRQLVDSNPRSLVAMAFGLTERSDRFHPEAAGIAARVIADADADTHLLFDAIRLLQLALGDVGPQQNLPAMLESYTARADPGPPAGTLESLRSLVTETFPSGDDACDRELIRCISMLGSEDVSLIDRLLAQIQTNSHPADDIHRLAALTKVVGQRTLEQSEATAVALINLEFKIEAQKLKQDSNWDDRISELFAAVCKADPLVARVIAEQKGFGLPGHVLFLHLIPPERTQRAIDGFVAAIKSDPDYKWNRDIVLVLGKSENPAHAKLIRDQRYNLSVLDAVLNVLSHNPLPDDRDVYLAGLNSPQLSAAEAAIRALMKLPQTNDPAEQYLLLSTARRLFHNPREYKLREDIIRLLQNNTEETAGFKFGTDGFTPQSEALHRWEQRLRSRFPDYAQTTDGGTSAERVLTTLSEVPWDQGDAALGEQLYAKLSCQRCHGGRQALGPDLQGVGRRFSRRDLFAAIVDPNRDVSERYQMTTVVTTGGKVYSGLIVYESVDGILLRDVDHNTIRIEAADIESNVKQRISLMPADLLRNLGNQDLADLDAFLRRL